MSSGFRGHNQEAGGGRKGPVSQRELVQLLKVLIDTSRSKASSKWRDDARRELRNLMSIANWDTPYVRRNIGARRCRYLIGLGYPVAAKDALRSDIERINAWNERHD